MIKNKKLFIISGLVFVVLMLSVLASAQVIDTDKDGIVDQKDNCPYEYNPKQGDSDNDGVGDVCDNCSAIYNPDQKNTDGDALGDACDPCDDRDFDKDGIRNCLDKCPNEPETYNQYQDDDGCPDKNPEEVKDSDKDGIPDEKDNCPLVYNPDQKDANKNGRGDACEDSDGDGIMDDKDNCPLVYNPKQEDTDKDGIGDACEVVQDSDKDGIPDDKDNCPKEPETFNNYQDEDGCPDSLPEIKPEAEPEIKPEVKPEVEKETEPPKISLTLTPPQPEAGERTKIEVKAIDESPIREIAIFLNEKPIEKCSQADYCQTEFVFRRHDEIYAAAIDFHNNVSARDVAGRGLGFDVNDNDNDGEINSFDNCRNISNSDQGDSDNDGVGNACDECDPIKMGRVTNLENFLLELQDFYIDNIGCGIRDTDSGLSYFTPGEIRKQKKDVEVLCDERIIGGRVYQMCEPGIKTEATDSCLNLGQVREYYVLNSSTGEFSYRDFNCPYGCQDGACICMGSDSDGGRNYYHQGYLAGTDRNLRENQEYCLNDYQLRELYRETRINERGEAFCAADVETHNCSIGCRDGTCICEDSDGGADYNVRGHVGQAGMDYCKDDNRTLVEYQARMTYDSRSHQNTCFIFSREYRCEGRCSEGRCFLATCDDGIQNQGEANIDCGGPCPIACNQVRISGRILYEEADAKLNSNDSRGFKPVRQARVRLRSSVSDNTLLTDNNGYFSFVLSRRPGVRYYLETRAINHVAQVQKDFDGCNEYIYWRSIPEIVIPETGNVDFGELRIGIDTNLEFTAYWYEAPACNWNQTNLNIQTGCSQYFNIAESLLLAYEYVWALPNARATDHIDQDSIERVDVQYPDSDWSNYNALWEEITLTGPHENRLDFGFVDATIIHEYGHHLQEELAADDIPNYIGDGHSWCGRVGDYETAFCEGFANYLSMVVYHHYKDPAHQNFISHVRYESDEILENGCSEKNGNIEGNVTSALWDLVDGYSSLPNFADESFDRLSGLEAFIIRVLDGEMDNFGDAPDICEMRDCWKEEDLRDLDDILIQYGIRCGGRGRTCGGG